MPKTAPAKDFNSAKGMEKILISGGTGLIGTRLTQLLPEYGYRPMILSRSKRDLKGTDSYIWDVREMQIDEAAIREADHIIHLAGAGVADKPWTEKRKREIMNSRVQSTRLLAQALDLTDNKVKSFISTSAVGFYGDGGDELLTEDKANGSDFLAKVCRNWEDEAQKIADTGLRTAIIRVGLVMSTQGGALPKMKQTAAFGLLSPFGDGRMYNPWIHLDDVCRMYIHAIQNENCSGVYNGAAPEPVRNSELVGAIKEAMDRFALVIPVPTFVLKTLLGELSIALLAGYKTSAKKILDSGFEFSQPDLVPALKDLMERKL